MVAATGVGDAVRAWCSRGLETWDWGPRRPRMHVRVLVSLIVASILLSPAMARAEDYFTLIVSGASGDPRYVETYERWRQGLVAALRARTEFREDHLIVLAETPGPGIGRASREGVRQAFAELRQRMTDDTVLLVVLFGHGTFDGFDAKFNLVGPDLEAAEWAALLDTVPGRAAVVNTAAASFPFLTRLAAVDRVVVTATETAAQQYDTVFPEFFVQAFVDVAADIDRNGRVSIWEAFEFASGNVRRWYQQQGRLATERSVLDDTGDGVGREADQPGVDGTRAARLYVGAGVEATPVITDPALAPLVARRAELEDQVADLRAGRAELDPEAYWAELERLLIELARVSREIRRRSAPS